MSAENDRLVASVAAIDSVIDSAIALIDGVVPQIRDAAGDRAKSLALADDLDAKKASLAASVAAGTPAA